MNQSVPKLCMGESSHPIDILTLATALTNKSSIAPNQALIDYARELTWRNGILRKGASVGRMPHLPITNQPSASLDRLESSGGTLESLVDQATRMTSLKSNTQSVILDAALKEFVQPFGERHQSLPATVPLCLTTDAAAENVPKEMNADQVPNIDCMLLCTPRYMQSMGSCSATSMVDPPISLFNVGATGGQSERGSAASWGRDTQQPTLDARSDKELRCLEYHSRSLDSPENTSCPKQYTKTMEEHDCQSRNERNRAAEEKENVIGKSSGTLRRGRTSASHNQSERKRRDRINQRLKTLQKLVPNSSKTDKASMLDEVIEYLKQLQAQINLIKLYFPTLMLPFTLQPPFQMPMMNAMSLGMNVGMEMGMNTMHLCSMGNNNIARMPSLLSPGAFMPPTSAAFMPPTSAAFMPPTSLDDFAVVDNLPGAAATTKLSSSTMVDPLTAFIGSQMLLPR